MKTIINNTPHTDDEIQKGIEAYIERYNNLDEKEKFVFPEIKTGYVVVITNPRLCESEDKWTIFNLQAIEVTEETSKQFASEGSKQDGYAVMVIE